MIRPIALAVLLGLAVAVCPARAAPEKDQQPPPIRLTAEPAAAPVPALKYTLLPQLRDRKRGNALLLYYRAFSPEWQGHRRTPKYLEKLADANEKRLRDLKPAEVDALANGYNRRMLGEVDRGARRTYCDWEQNQPFREEGIGLLIPDIQGLRDFASLLKLRARQELLAGEYARAARTIQTGIQLGRHASEGPTLIHCLVGVACISAMLSVVDDWIERPGAPNLYWALTDLPRPLISMRNGIEGERFLMDWLFPGYREWLDDPRAPSPAPARTSLQQYAYLLEDSPNPYRTLVPLLVALKTYPRAKRFLRQKGRSAREVEAMPALQAVYLYEINQYDVAYDDLRKWANLPYAEAAPHIRRASLRARERARRDGLPSLAGVLLPAVEKVLAAPARIERKVAALRCVEALRLHAAAHGGKLPARLDEITEVPIPLDPRTGKPFDYRRDGDRATLTGPAPSGETANLNNTIRYELTIRPASPKRERGKENKGK
jgi:hypothetical protein